MRGSSISGARLVSQGGISWNTGIESSIASIAERNSFSPQANNFSSRIRGSKTSRSAVRPVSPREASCSTDRAIGVWKPAQSAHNAARKPRYPSSRPRGAPSIAGNASNSVGQQDPRLDLIAANRLFISPERDWAWVYGAWWEALNTQAESVPTARL
jgi:hypothetical protein